MPKRRIGECALSRKYSTFETNVQHWRKDKEQGLDVSSTCEYHQTAEQLSSLYFTGKGGPYVQGHLTVKHSIMKLTALNHFRIDIVSGGGGGGGALSCAH